jgi:CRISPR-associated protein Cas8b1/Cst1 subtype I-B
MFLNLEMFTKIILMNSVQKLTCKMSNIIIVYLTFNMISNLNL